jgi:hypothetical protein
MHAVPSIGLFSSPLCFQSSYFQNSELLSFLSLQSSLLSFFSPFFSPLCSLFSAIFSSFLHSVSPVFLRSYLFSIASPLFFYFYSPPNSFYPVLFTLLFQSSLLSFCSPRYLPFTDPLQNPFPTLYSFSPFLYSLLSKYQHIRPWHYLTMICLHIFFLSLSLPLFLRLFMSLNTLTYLSFCLAYL